jgi:hypothetical protein
MKDFLEAHSSEVINMLFVEFNLDDALKIRYEEGIETGEERGEERGIQIGEERGQNQVLDLLRQGYTTKEIEQMLKNT